MVWADWARKTGLGIIVSTIAWLAFAFLPGKDWAPYDTFAQAVNAGQSVPVALLGFGMPIALAIAGMYFFSKAQTKGGLIATIAASLSISGLLLSGNPQVEFTAFAIVGGTTTLSIGWENQVRKITTWVENNLDSLIVPFVIFYTYVVLRLIIEGYKIL